jgi:hypothetical protein
MKNNTVIDFPQPDAGPRPRPPTGENITMRRSVGLIFEPDEVLKTSLFRQKSYIASALQIRVLLASWLETPAGSLPADPALVHSMVRLPEDPNSWRDFCRHRQAIMRGWYLCSDGRLYHPFVARQVERCWRARKRPVDPDNVEF